MELKYTCKYCAHTNKITNFWAWLFTPHFGAKKWLKCKHCCARRHFMERQNWSGPKWLDWPKDNI